MRHYQFIAPLARALSCGLIVALVAVGANGQVWVPYSSVNAAVELSNGTNGFIARNRDMDLVSGSNSPGSPPLPVSVQLPPGRYALRVDGRWDSGAFWYSGSAGQRVATTMRCEFSAPVALSAPNGALAVSASAAPTGASYSNTGMSFPWSDSARRSATGSASSASVDGTWRASLAPPGGAAMALEFTASLVTDVAKQDDRPAFGCSATVQGQFEMAVDVTQPTFVTLAIVRQTTPRGSAQSFPRMPNVTGPGSWGFTRTPRRYWHDPPLALGYEFRMGSSSLFTEVTSLPVGIDDDGMFEIVVGGQSLGAFAEGSGVDFRALIGGNGVRDFQVLGVDPAKDATNVEGFPIQLDFSTNEVDFTMTPITWRKMGSSCFDAAGCTTCPGLSLEPVGDALVGNSSFGLSLSNGPTGGAAIWFFGVGSPSVSPLPLLCGAVYPQLPVLFLPGAAITGTSACDGTAQLGLPIPSDPLLFGAFVTAQSLFLCPGGGLGLSHGIEFPIGS